jgi:hypothetical protein
MTPFLKQALFLILLRPLLSETPEPLLVRSPGKYDTPVPQPLAWLLLVAVITVRLHRVVVKAEIQFIMNIAWWKLLLLLM